MNGEAIWQFIIRIIKEDCGQDFEVWLLEHADERREELKELLV
ncbi:hypothetical protein LCGC14_2322900 [marine sediment metagenome]|uniref:Uncharacterized protein n=1 Tax=marine sediment metagenome TaxID=412755 RepID=A0A0F9EUN8_9ZZZZ